MIRGRNLMLDYTLSQQRGEHMVTEMRALITNQCMWSAKSRENISLEELNLISPFIAGRATTSTQLET